MRRLLAPVLAVLAVLLVLGSPLFAAVPTPADIVCSQAEDCRQPLLLKAGNYPVDVTGYSYQAQIRASYSDSVPLATFTVDTTGAALGQLVLILPQSVTATLGGKTGIWDLRQTDLDGNATYMVRGNFKCLYSVTRP
jgi:hypothetical protein